MRGIRDGGVLGTMVRRSKADWFNGGESCSREDSGVVFLLFIDSFMF